MSTLCPKCGFENPGGVNVCGRCATPLARICSGCGFQSPGNFRFCGNCGLPLDAEGPHAPGAESRPHAGAPIPAPLAEKVSRAGKQIEGERRTVTILFSDISGFTTLSEKLDPEQVYDFVDRLQADFNAEIYQHEGWVDKWMGDGVMALFGAPIAHEDDPARAVRAALGLQEALQRINAEWEERLGTRLKMRVGLNSGLVVVGSVGSDMRMDYTALGDTVNVASRLQSVAEPGSVLVSRSVYQQTQALYEFLELGSIRVKNRVEPVDIYEVVAPRLKAGRVRGIPGLAAPMVGRADELAQLRQAADELMGTRRGRIVLLTGNAGIGKSRLTAEFRNYLAGRPAGVLEGACLSYGQPAYGVFIRLLKGLFEIADEDPAETVREKIESLTRPLSKDSAPNSILPYIENLFGLRLIEKELATRIRHLSPAQLQQQTFLAIRDLFVARAREKPLILIFEDIHWIDQLSLDLLTFMLGAVEDSPLLIFCNSRPAEGQAAPQIQRLGAASYATSFLHIQLAPLSQADSVALVDLLLTISDLPESLKQLIPARAEGNPFYLEEIIRMLIDRGIIHRRENRWHIDPEADLSAIQVPGTLQGLIMARVDHLSESARQVIQCAAVIGRDFSYPLLSAVAEGAPDLDDQVRELEERELIDRDPALDREFRFHHVLIQETLYNSLLVRRRERLHQKIAQGIEALFPDRTEDHVEQLAFHYAESKSIDRALPYLVRAGQRAADRFANDEALHYYRQAAEFLLKTDAPVEQRIQTYAGLGSVQSFVADYAGAVNSYRTALELSRTSSPASPARRTAELMRSLGRVYERRGEYAEALHWLDDALFELDRDETAARSEERAHILNDIGWVHYRRGEFDDAYQWRMRSLQLIEGTDHYSEIAAAYAGLVALFTRKGDWARALAYGEKGLELRETIGDTFGVSQSHVSLGAIAAEQCQWDRALEHFAQALEIKQRIGDVDGISLLSSNLGLLYLEKGDYARAAPSCQKALEIAEKVKNGNLTCLALNNLADVHIRQGQFDDAVPYLLRSLSIAGEMGSKEQLAEVQSLLAEASYGQKLFEPAGQMARQAVTLAAEIGSLLIEGKSLRTLAKLACQGGDLRAAEEQLNRALKILTDLKNPYEIAKTEFQFALLLRDRGERPQARTMMEQSARTFERLGAQAEYRQAQAELQRMDGQIPVG